MSSLNIEKIRQGFAKNRAIKAWLTKYPGLEVVLLKHVQRIPLILGDVLDQPLNKRSLVSLWTRWFSYCALTDFCHDVSACIVSEESFARMKSLVTLMSDYCNEAEAFERAIETGDLANDPDDGFLSFIAAVMPPFAFSLFRSGHLTVAELVEEHPACLFTKRMLAEINFAVSANATPRRASTAAVN